MTSDSGGEHPATGVRGGGQKKWALDFPGKCMRKQGSHIGEVEFSFWSGNFAFPVPKRFL
jgi:hypothetical protein